MSASKDNPAPDLSLIFPILNEESKIAGDIRSAAEFFYGLGKVTEIIIADDGSSDRGVEVARETEAHLPDDISLVILENKIHRGKGFAVRNGIQAAQGEIIIFADSGGNVTWEFLLAGIKLIEHGTCQIAHGSRKLPESTILKQPSLFRRFLSGFFRWFSSLILPIPGHLTDTQCGLKLYTNQAAKTLYEKCVLDGFLFDLEIILRASRAGFEIVEFPLDWACDSDSRLHYFKNMSQMIREIRYLLKRGRSSQI
jgi:dolichyl-phosphate beta-glucosyltransferase